MINTFMNYKIHYNKLIDRAKNRILDEGYEVHHVMPRCLGGTDDSDNLVKLTPEEHYIAHQLLVKIYPNENKLVYAAMMMCVGNKRNNKRYGWLKRKYHSICKQRIGEKNGAFGSRWISNPDTGETLKIKQHEKIPDGFVLGRNITNKFCKVCGNKYLGPLKHVCSLECKKHRGKKITDELAFALLTDYESGMPMKDILQKYNRKSEQSVTTFLRKRFPNRKTFLPGKRESIS
jgi:hypothetical protein